MNDTKQALRTKRLITEYTSDIKMRKEKIAYAENLITKLEAELEFHDRELSNLRHERTRLIAGH